MAKAPRGRPRMFDEDEALDTAIGLFWQSGYRGTTTRDLEAALNMRQPSIYNAFGSKRDLLLRAMDKYEANVKRDLFDVLDSEDDGYQAVLEFFRRLGTWMEQSGYHGCLMVNLMNGEVDDDLVIDRVRAFRANILDGFVDAIGRSETNRTLVATRANVLQAAVLGLHTAAATARSPKEVQAMIVGICDLVAGWQAVALAPAPAEA